MDPVVEVVRVSTASGTIDSGRRPNEAASR
jgi:hypothetical protein